MDECQWEESGNQWVEVVECLVWEFVEVVGSEFKCQRWEENPHVRYLENEVKRGVRFVLSECSKDVLITVS